MPAVPLLDLDAVSKRFAGVAALSGVSLTLNAGEVTAVIGENGAGKSTLVKILTGIHSPDSGEIRLNGNKTVLRNPSDARACGITAVHQETVMFDELSVAENIFAGHWPVTRFGRVDWPEMRKKTQNLLDQLEAHFSPDDLLKSLSVAHKHLVEIARALSHDARIVIMDEPTAALSRHEIDDLFKIITALKREGRAILFISHKFDEIFSICDRYVVLRDGSRVGEGAIAAATQDMLVRLMVGRPVDQIFPKRVANPGKTMLEVEGLGNRVEFDNISFSVRCGEIIGFYGLVGAGRSEVMQALFGISAKSQGTIKIDGSAIALASPGAAIRAGIAYVPEDRQVQGGILSQGIRQNVALASLGQLSSWGLVSRKREINLTRKYGTRLAAKANNWEQRLLELSGGNQQKIVVAKWLATMPKILILDEPTKGIDIGSKAAVHEFIGELAGEGLAVVLVSSELPEIMGMSDKIIVMCQGRISARFDRADATPEKLVLAASSAEAA